MQPIWRGWLCYQKNPIDRYRTPEETIESFLGVDAAAEAPQGLLLQRILWYSYQNRRLGCASIRRIPLTRHRKAIAQLHHARSPQKCQDHACKARLLNHWRVESRSRRSQRLERDSLLQLSFHLTGSFQCWLLLPALELLVTLRHVAMARAFNARTVSVPLCWTPYAMLSVALTNSPPMRRPTLCTN